MEFLYSMTPPVTLPLEARLLEKSRDMLTRYEAICARPWRWDLVKAFQQPLMEYMEAFRAWKPADEEKLKSRIQRALMMMYQTPHENAEMFTVQINRLRAKLDSMDPLLLVQFDLMRQTMIVPQ